MDDRRVPAVPLEDVLDAERKDIKIIRELRKTHDAAFSAGGPRRHATPPPVSAPAPHHEHLHEPAWHTENKKWTEAVRKAHESNFVGLAFSGGGIRSATFNLGILQALADLKLLHRVDYLSTVSGGGYIGGWLAAWIKREKSFAKVQKQLSPNRVHQEDDKEPTPLRFLRMFSNYLTPKMGFFSGDTWAMITIYLRNTILNLTIVLALVAAALLAPRLVDRWAGGSNYQHHPFLALLEVILFLAALSTILINMTFLDSRTPKKTPRITLQATILIVVSIPIFVATVIAALNPWRAKDLIDAPRNWAIFFAALWLLATLAALIARAIFPGLRPPPPAQDTDVLPDTKPGKPAAHVTVIRLRGFGEILRQVGMALGETLSAAIAGALAGWLFALLSGPMLNWDAKARLTVGGPLVLGIFLLAGSLHIGLMGTVFRDWKREWWGRLGGWLLLWAILWVALFWIALYFPAFILTNHFVNKTLAEISAKYLTPAWILSTLGSILVGNSKSSGDPNKKSWLDVVAKVGPYVFILGLLCWVSYLLCTLDCYFAGSGLYWAFGGCIVFSFVMAWRVDINEFSMHLFYRNRLVRCYLGASNLHRSPNRFTGFDRTDDVPLKDLRIDAQNSTHPKDPFDPYDGPYPILNMSLNLVKGGNLAWQERKAESFIMTPRFCGYDVWLEQQDNAVQEGRTSEAAHKEEDKKTGAFAEFHEALRRLDEFGYRPTEKYAFPPPFYGPFLGLAMSISGAAASPNMGSYSSTPVGFLMTIFNVRLGQWLGNPRHRRAWLRPSPRLGLSYLVNELFGGTDDKAAFVYLSDGGHFENMGLYELVKRRCGLIILGDAEADGNYGYEGLGNAIRKCRIDLGIPIDLNVDSIKPAGEGQPSQSHCAIGTIHYENADINAPAGTIIYFKASLTGDEPADIKNYKTKNSTFPHETTADQWFTESQFESYRQLGYHEVMISILGAAAAQGDSPSRAPFPSALSSSGPRNNGPGGESKDEAAEKEKPAKKAAARSYERKPEAAEAPAVTPPPPLESLLQPEFAKFGFDITMLPRAHETECHE